METFYRPRPARLLEYGAWVVYSVLRPGRVGRLSVGAAQVQLRHWHRWGQLPGVRFTPGRLATVLRWSANYHACHAFLAEHGALHLDDPARLTRLYTGWDRPGYAGRLRHARRALHRH